VKLQLRGGIAVIAIAGSALIAAGCGGDSGSKSAAKDAAALDFVPATAIGYVTVDTDFEGDGWTRFSEIAAAFDEDFEPIQDQLAEATAEGDDEIDFAEEVDPWLGDTGGLAILAPATSDDDDSGDSSDMNNLFLWLEVEDRAALEEFAKDRDLEEGDAVGDFTIWSNDDTAIGVSDDLAILADGPEQVESAVEYDGDSIKDVDGVSDAIDGVAGDALATIVFNGAGLRAAIESDDQLEVVADLDQLKDLQAVALSFSAGDDGLRLDGRVSSTSETELENAENDVFEALPSDTVLALGGLDFGGNVADLLDSLGKDNSEVQQGVGAVSAVLGITPDDLEKAFDGSFAVAFGGRDEGLGGLVGGVAGAALGGGSVDAGQLSGLLGSGAVTLAFEETGATAETLEKILTGASALTGGTRAIARGTTAGDFETKTIGVQGVPVTVASSDDVAGLSVGLDVFSTWGEKSLGDLEAFEDAWKAADAPGKVAASMWLDFPRVATLSGLEGADDTELGGWVGWIEADGPNASFSVFMHVPES
jgi:hypothetical protein